MQALAFLSLGLLAAISLLGCGLPAPLAVIGAFAAALHGARLARDELRRRRTAFDIPHRGPAVVDGMPVDDLAVAWRGTLAFLGWRDAAGRRCRRMATPDLLDRAARRELRLACAARIPARGRPPVAP